MSYEGRTAIVTGAASGIGLALSRALVARGARVWLTDIDRDAVEAAAESIGRGARAARLDVRDAAGFDALAARVVAGSGAIDLLFNNAGIGVAGEMQTLTVGHFDRIVDVNVRGVMNGIAAVYPRMVERGEGHIVNTASAGGLLPMPLCTPYSMTKHAVVGLTRSLRLEAECHGVRVSALCPSTLETPLLDARNPADLPAVWMPDLRSYLSRLAGTPSDCDAYVAYALDRIEANQAIIVGPAMARVGHWLFRLAPALIERRTRQALRDELAARSVR